MKQTKNKQKKKQNKNEKQEKINLSNEIIIGLTPKKEETIKSDNKKRKPKIKKRINKNNKSNKSNKNKPKTKQLNKKKKPIKKPNTNKKKRVAILKWISLGILLILLIILFLSSSIFNIREIVVENNSKITAEEIIKLSTLETGVNMFKYSNKTITNGIKTNSYIESVEIKRGLNGVVTLIITERKPSYMLKFANSYVYINNQGYILELSEEPLELPIIVGYETSNDDLKDGNRLIISDLEKLDDVIKIMNSATEVSLGKLIKTIDITDKNNYILSLDSENKIVKFGPATNINIKLLKIQEVLENEKDVSGEIYFQDSERTVFKENV